VDVWSRAVGRRVCALHLGTPALSVPYSMKTRDPEDLPSQAKLSVGCPFAFSQCQDQPTSMGSYLSCRRHVQSGSTMIAWRGWATTLCAPYQSGGSRMAEGRIVFDHPGSSVRKSPPVATGSAPAGANSLEKECRCGGIASTEPIPERPSLANPERSNGRGACR